jgi:transposase-like protein
MQMVVQGVSTRRVNEITTELYGRQIRKWAYRFLEKQSYPLLVLWPSAPEGSALGCSAIDNRRCWRRFTSQIERQGLFGAHFATSDVQEDLACALREAFPVLIWQR